MSARTEIDRVVPPFQTTCVAESRISQGTDARILCKHAQRPHRDTMARDRFIPASPQPQRLTRQGYPRLRPVLNLNRYLSAFGHRRPPTGAAHPYVDDQGPGAMHPRTLAGPTPITTHKPSLIRPFDPPAKTRAVPTMR